MQLSPQIAAHDKSKWVSYELDAGNSCYYGEVAHLDEHNNIHVQQTSATTTSPQNPPSPIQPNPKHRLVRHGLGIYVYSQHEGKITSYYQGTWDRECRSKQGTMVYSDGSKYTGSWKDDLRSGFGIMNWNSEYTYEGTWSRDKMQGAGTFTNHKTGEVLKGIFRSNYIIQNEIALRNPFMGPQDLDNYRVARRDLPKLKEQMNKYKHSYLQRIKSSEMAVIAQAIDKSNTNNRVPLIICSEELTLEVTGLAHGYETANHKKCHVFDLRKAFISKDNHRREQLQKTRAMLLSSLQNGEFFLISLDDSETPYSEIFYPDLREFYSPDSFPSEIWNHSEILRKEVYQTISSDLESVDKEFRFGVWSKHRFSGQLTDEQLRERLEERFASVIPLIKVDYIFLVAS